MPSCNSGSSFVVVLKQRVFIFSSIFLIICNSGHISFIFALLSPCNLTLDTTPLTSRHHFIPHILHCLRCLYGSLGTNLKSYWSRMLPSFTVTNIIGLSFCIWLIPLFWITMSDRTPKCVKVSSVASHLNQSFVCVFNLFLLGSEPPYRYFMILKF